MNGCLFGEYLLECMERWSRDNPDEYVNPNMLIDITGAIYLYQDAEKDSVDDWARGMFEM